MNQTTLLLVQNIQQTESCLLPPPHLKYLEGESNLIIDIRSFGVSLFLNPLP